MYCRWESVVRNPEHARLVRVLGMLINHLQTWLQRVWPYYFTWCQTSFPNHTMGHPILGKQVCVQLKLLTRINEVGTKDKPASKDEGSKCDYKQSELVVNRYSDVFSGLDLIKPHATIHVDPSIIPVIDPPSTNTLYHSKSSQSRITMHVWSYCRTNRTYELSELDDVGFLQTVTIIIDSVRNSKQWA